MPRLRLIQENGTNFEITQDGASLGREGPCTVVLPHSTVSSRHAVFRQRGDAWFVVDQRSTNGTWLDERKVADEAPLRHGQRLRFGAMVFTVELQGPERTPTPSPLTSGSDPRAEAAGMLGIPLAAPIAVARERYQRLYNDFQIRLTNAPTAALKRKYQQSLTDLRKSFDVLFPGQRP